MQTKGIISTIHARLPRDCRRLEKSLKSDGGEADLVNAEREEDKGGPVNPNSIPNLEITFVHGPFHLSA